MNEEPTQLICTRLADMWKMHPQQIIRKCVRCHQEVGVYPSGQGEIKRYPNMEIVCVPCAMEDQREVIKIKPAGSMDTVIQEIRDSYLTKDRQ